MGTDNDNWKSVMKMHYIDPTDDFKSNVIDPKLKADLRATHFVCGNQKNDFKTMQEDFGKKLCNPSRLNPLLAKDLRSHHFKTSDKVGEYKTIYEGQYIWKINDDF